MRANRWSDEVLILPPVAPIRDFIRRWAIETGKKVMLLTNGSTSTPAKLATRLHRLLDLGAPSFGGGRVSDLVALCFYVKRMDTNHLVAVIPRVLRSKNDG